MRVDFVSDQDDWVQLYVDGNLRFAGHSVPPWIMKELILLPVHSVKDWYWNFEESYLSDHIDFEDPRVIEMFALELGG